MYLKIPKRDGDRGTPGPWWWPADDYGKKTATFRCPDCGAIGALTDHNISSTGVVGPSVVCPKLCGFHAFLKLEDWDV